MADKSSSSKTKRPSESMIRIMGLLKAKKFLPGDTVSFEISATNGKFKYAARFGDDGRITKAEEVSAPVQPEEGSNIGDVEWDSPTDFVNAMYAFAEARLPPKTRRGTLNGWAECFFDGKCLNDIFSSFLRERTATRNEEVSGKQKPSEKAVVEDGEIGPSKGKTAPPAIGASSTDLSYPPNQEKSTSNPIESNDTAEPRSTRKDSTVERKENVQLESEKVREVSGSKSRIIDSKTRKIESSDNYEKKSPKNSIEKKMDGGYRAIEDDKNANVKESEKKQNDLNANTDVGDGPEAANVSVGEAKSAKKEKQDKGSAANDEVSDKKEISTNGDVDEETRGDEGTDSKVNQENTKSAEMMDDSVEDDAKGDVKSNKCANGDGEVVGSDEGSGSKVSDSSMDEQGKKKKGNSKTQKRKRSITPQSDVDRATRAKSRRRILDPEAAEAARVAAQAEKLELKSLRPTTRLTSGKIPKVVYNASPKTMASESPEVLPEETSRTNRRKESSRRTPRKRTKGANADESDRERESDRDDVEMEMEIEEKNDTVNLLNQLAIAIGRTGSTTPAVIASELRGKSLSMEEARMFVTNMLDNIRRANTEVGHESEGSDVVKQMQAYIGAEVSRWENANVKRPLSLITRRKTRLERRGPLLEKRKRRKKRENDESTTKLEGAMEERRKNMSDESKVACKLTIARMELEDAKECRDEVMKKVERIRKQDAEFRKRVDKTRKFYNELLSVAKSSRNAVNNRASGASASKRRKLDSRTEITSDDERVEDAKSGGAVSLGGAPEEEDGDELMKELERLRKLVKSRGAGAEEKQRQCQMMHMEVRKLMNEKIRMDNQVYRRKTRRNTAAKVMANGYNGNNHNSSSGIVKKNTNHGESNTRKSSGGGRPRGGGGRGGRKKKENDKNTKGSVRKSGRPSSAAAAGSGN